jgi:hypothetical protein
LETVWVDMACSPFYNSSSILLYKYFYIDKSGDT